jgi:hypothetical protein
MMQVIGLETRSLVRAVSKAHKCGVRKGRKKKKLDNRKSTLVAHAAIFPNLKLDFDGSEPLNS